jgi:hypothetical protein
MKVNSLSQALLGFTSFQFISSENMCKQGVSMMTMGVLDSFQSFFFITTIAQGNLQDRSNNSLEWSRGFQLMELI